jgi:hypothetical protein
MHLTTTKLMMIVGIALAAFGIFGSENLPISIVIAVNVVGFCLVASCFVALFIQWRSHRKESAQQIEEELYQAVYSKLVERIDLFCPQPSRPVTLLDAHSHDLLFPYRDAANNRVIVSRTLKRMSHWINVCDMLYHFSIDELSVTTSLAVHNFELEASCTDPTWLFDTIEFTGQRKATRKELSRLFGQLARIHAP